jgi:glycosyltransferase involved in cell wall biosynthesis
VKICLVHNSYGRRSGEEVAVDGLRDALRAGGHRVVPFFKSNETLYEHPLTRIDAFFSGIYSAAARREVAALLDAEAPDLVHINNLFPLISPSNLEETRRRGVPAVMTLHNFRLLCPTGLLFSHGDVCHRCIGGREWWCALRNCTGERARSVGYAVRSAVARIRNTFALAIDRFIAPSAFLKAIHVEHGWPAERIDVVRHLLKPDVAPPANSDGDYVAYVGRVSPEKGVDTIVEAARACPQIPFRFAGHFLRMPNVPKSAPTNCEFMGELAAERVGEFLGRARMTIFASRWYEVAPLSLAEAMASSKAVVCANIGSLPEFVEDGVTGLLFEPGNARDLAEKVRYLWERPELCRRLGEAARKKALAIFSIEANYARLMDTYRRAMGKGQKPDAQSPAIGTAGC